MKKTIALFFASLVLATSAFADSLPFPMTVAIKGGGLVPLSDNVTDIYSDVFPLVELEVSTVWNCHWKPWMNVGYTWDSGHSVCEGDEDHSDGLHLCHNKTDIRVIPLSFGVDYMVYSICDIDFHVGAGASYSWLKIHDKSPYVHQHIDKGAWGAIARASAVYNWCNCLFVEGFLNYSYTNFEFRNHHRHSNSDVVTDGDICPYTERHDLNFSNLQFGIGLGYTF